MPATQADLPTKPYSTSPHHSSSDLAYHTQGASSSPALVNSEKDMYKGISTGKADGYRPGILNLGRPTQLNLFKDGKVSVEEAFYYARHILRTNPELKDFRSMQPQINDKYPHQGYLLNSRELFLTEH